MINENQYASSKKYEARIYLSKKFRTNPVSKLEWIFDCFPKKESLAILELGCGTGLFWLANRNRIPRSWSMLLTDYSSGMLETTRGNLSRLSRDFRFEQLNAEDIQYGDAAFDVVLANNMLYHLQNRDRTFENIHRILKDDGVFIASTMGKGNLSELHHHLYAFLDGKRHPFRFRELAFSLDNGMEQLSKHFRNVELKKHPDELVIDEADAVVNYYLSLNEISGRAIILPEEYGAEFRDYLQNIIEKEGPLRTTKDEGVFVCSR